MISIIIPTYNEAGNIRKLILLIQKELSKRREKFEIIVVDDDSPDKTWEIIEGLIKKNPYSNVRIIRRKNERGLSSAVIAGFKHSKGDILGVIDADLSHPTELMNKMIDECKNSDIVIASRYAGGGSEEFTIFRRLVSKGATLMARPLTKVTDPMTGYFFFNKKIIKNANIRPRGYKILLEILVKGKYNKFKEIDMSFKKRHSGKSKLGAKVYIDYILHLMSLYLYKIKNL